MHLPMTFQVASGVREVLDTFSVAAELGSDSLGAYVISMASNVWHTTFIIDFQHCIYKAKELDFPISNCEVSIHELFVKIDKMQPCTL